MATATYNEKDQNWQEESTTYWFTLNGTDTGTDHHFTDEVFGVVESGSMETVIVDSDGCPMTDGDHQTIAVRNTVKVTDAMRLDQEAQ